MDLVKTKEKEVSGVNKADCWLLNNYNSSKVNMKGEDGI